ncbi:MAG: NrfD/PsrC family molybdoenzyme membrane anchor subunit [Dehalococcoidia bacterium]|nr:NrfD/PsrC family molybdoenzyme membrane anchor subunit [Dehalococcoidia bacterium]
METNRPVDEYQQRLERSALSPLAKLDRGFMLLVLGLLAVIAIGAFAYIYQWQHGLIVTGMRDRISWGLYVVMFVFFIGVSMAGTLISSILRIANAEWRLPITRMAEFVTFCALLVAPLFILLDMGQPTRVGNLLTFGRWQSPLLWDVFGLTTYLIGSAIYLYLALIPDMALCRDSEHLKKHPLKVFFSGLAINWRGTPQQHETLHKALKVVMIGIIPVAVSMHTVTSWIFAMTLREPWDSAMYPAFFVAGALYSGVGVLIIVMAVLRKVLHLEEYFTLQHFKNLGYMLVAFAALVMFFNVSEYVTSGFKLKGDTEAYLHNMFLGSLAPFYWTYAFGGMVLPVLIIAYPKARRIGIIVLAAILANIGMWIERYLIVVGGLSLPLQPYQPATYSPTWVEWSLMAAGIAAFALLIAVISKLVPVVAVWEMVAHRQHKLAPQAALETSEGGASGKASRRRVMTPAFPSEVAGRRPIGTAFPSVEAQARKSTINAVFPPSERAEQG